MSMSTSVYGLLDVQDEELKMMQVVIENCNKLGISIPEEIKARLKKIGLSELDFEDKGEITVSIPKREYNDDYRQGFEVDVNKIPKKVKTLRFVNSW